MPPPALETPALETLDLERQDAWLTLWLDRPQVRNALSNRMVAELHRTLDDLAADRTLRGITIRGRGGTFCAGGDLKDFRDLFEKAEAGREEAAAFSRAAGELFHRVETMPQVVVMAVEGAAMAGGLGMVCAGDIVIASDDAVFGLSETRIGIPAAQIAPFVVRRIGLRHARRLMLTAARFDAAEAMAMGLADRIVPAGSGLAAAEAELRDAVRHCAPGANAASKRIMLDVDETERRRRVDAAADIFADCLVGPEGREGIAAFLQKRPPVWSGDGSGS